MSSNFRKAESPAMTSRVTFYLQDGEPDIVLTGKNKIKTVCPKCNSKQYRDDIQVTKEIKM